MNVRLRFARLRTHLPRAQNCRWHTDCPAHEGGMCAECFEDREARRDCGFCEGLFCTDCLHETCCVRGCNTVVCDPCLNDGLYRGAPILTRCGDCGKQACPAHTAVCARCTDVRVLPGRRYAPPDRRALASSGVRAVMQCCACKRVYCHECDADEASGGRDWAQAGVACTEDNRRDWAPHAELGCLLCCSRPGACTGLAAERLQRQRARERPAEPERDEEEVEEDDGARSSDSASAESEERVRA